MAKRPYAPRHRWGALSADPGWIKQECTHCDVVRRRYQRGDWEYMSDADSWRKERIACARRKDDEGIVSTSRAKWEPPTESTESRIARSELLMIVTDLRLCELRLARPWGLHVTAKRAATIAEAHASVHGAVLQLLAEVRG